MGQITAKAEPKAPERFNFDLTSEGPGKILAFSGKIGSGKDSACRFLYSLAFMHVLGITPNAAVNEETGKLWIETEEGFHEFDEDNRSPEARQWLNQHVWPFIRKFSTADPMKDFLHKMFQVPAESLWGTQAQKNEPISHLLWENLVGDPEIKLSNNKKLKDMSGPISGRELMEYYGTEVVRRLFPRAHAKALVSDILEYNSKHSLVNDIRFADECEEIQAVGGKIIRFTRCTPEAKKNKHRSNIELDSYDKFDKVIDNQKLTLYDTFAELMKVLMEWEYFKVVN